jgi:cytochrome b6-f complex iron-sulfur subunit
MDPREVGRSASVLRTPAATIRAARTTQVGGVSRRQLLRRALGAGALLWLVEMTAGTIGFLWPAAGGGSGRVRVGTYAELLAQQGDLPIADGFPAYIAEAHAFVAVVDPTRGGWTPGTDETGDGTATNVRALWQRCPHLGCRPNPCIEDFWFHCPCHQSRYDRLGTKVAGIRYGPAARSMDRFRTSVDDRGVLTIDTSRVLLGPLPIELGMPGVIPPLVANGCV